MYPNMYKNPTVTVDVWGEFASFTQVQTKVERRSYEVITPSAARGILCSIYMKPVEFYYQVRKIQVIDPGYSITMYQNNMKRKADPADARKTVRHAYIHSDNCRTRRGIEYLRHVYYRITAEMVPINGTNPNKIRTEFYQRVLNGKCFRQPFLGMRECIADFGPVNPKLRPIEDSKTYDLTLYDVFDIRKNIKLNTRTKGYNRNEVIKPTFYVPRMVHGTIEVPPYEDIINRDRENSEKNNFSERGSY